MKYINYEVETTVRTCPDCLQEREVYVKRGGPTNSVECSACGHEAAEPMWDEQLAVCDAEGLL